MFEPQDHPNDFLYPGGPPIPPYDNAGYTLAYQMGVQFDRVLDAFDGPFQVVSGPQKPPSGQAAPAGAAGYLVSHRLNDAVVVTNRLLKAGEEVSWLKRPTSVGGHEEEGAIFVGGKPGALSILQKGASELGVSFHAAASRPDGDALRLRAPRLGLVDRYGGLMPSGWIRFLFEQFEVPFEVVCPQALDAGDLRKKYDALVFVGGSVPVRNARAAGPGGDAGGFFGGPPENLPAEFQAWTGTVTAEKTFPQLRKFVEQGGAIIAIGSAAKGVAQHLELPVADALVEKTAEGEKPLSNEKLYIPGSVLRTTVDTSQPLAYGLAAQTDVFFDNNPVFELLPSAALKGTRAVAWFDTAEPLRSGWAWGQHYLKGGAAVVEASLGRGKVFLLGPEVTFRGQPHGTFKLLFNAIYYGAASAGAEGSSTATGGQQ
jgi:hypothetical protein